jgi:hypothetical protein
METQPDQDVRYEAYDAEIDEAPEGDPRTDCTGEEESDGSS